MVATGDGKECSGRELGVPFPRSRCTLDTVKQGTRFRSDVGQPILCEGIIFCMSDVLSHRLDPISVASICERRRGQRSILRAFIPEN